MSTCTSELIFGKANMNDSGIGFNHRLTLYEGSRAMIAFERKPSPTGGGALVDRWVPHADKILEDSMIMLAGYGAGDETVLQLITEMRQGREDQEIIDLNSVDDELMEKLYAASKQAFKLEIRQGKNGRNSERWKITACLFSHSSMSRSVERFHNYDIDIEICQSVYQSEYSAWNEKVNVWGELR
jgi:hypothetical protein